MGRTPKPLSVLIHPSLETLAAIQELREKGHWVTTSPARPDGSACSPWEFDVILSPSAWRMTIELAKYLPMMLKEVRSEKYPKGTTDAT